MKKNFMRTSGYAVAAMAFPFLISSCINNDETIGNDSTPALETLTLSINAGASTTRSALTTNPTEDSEKTINRITVGLFDSEGKVKTIKEATSLENGTITVTSNAIVTTDVVCVAVNAPANTFASVTTKDAFMAKTETLENAVASSTSDTPIATNLPMFGIGTITGSGTSYTSAVSVSHLVAKISLVSLQVDFDQSGAYTEATFTPTQFFLTNVPDGLKFNSSPWITSTTWFDGFAGTSEERTALALTSTYKKYLGTGALEESIVLSGNDTYSGTAYFYTTPNNNTTSNTRLVIAGSFDPDGNGAEAAITKYYPVNINYQYNAGTKTAAAVDGGTVNVVSPNKNYKLSITIKGKGVEKPSETIEDGSVVVTPTVSAFDEVNQSNTFE